MDSTLKKIFESFMKNKFSHIDKEEAYYSEWEKRFEEGMEWQKSDYHGRNLLMFLAPDIYPKDKDEFFIRI